jgi:membrane protease YdiL (CAAX protease family)
LPARAGVTPGERGEQPGRHLPAFFALAYALTWVVWIPAGLADRGTITLGMPTFALYVLGGFGPLAAAVILSARHGGRGAVRALFAQLNPRRPAARWLLIPVLLVPLGLVPVGGFLAAGGRLPGDALLGIALTFLAQLVLVATIGGGLDEETGWRGYALPRMLRTRHPVTASLALGLLWAPWHLPLWLDPAGTHAAYPFWVFLVDTVTRSVLIGWMYCASGGSLLVAIWAHALANGADGVRYQILGADKGDLSHQLALVAAHLVAVFVVIAATRGRLGADHLLRSAVATTTEPSERHPDRSHNHTTV